MPTLFAIAAALLIGWVSPAAAEKWDLASGYPDSNFHTQNLNQFIQDVKQATRGELDITPHSNQALFKLAEIKRAVQSRQVPIGEILLVQFGNEDPFYEVSSIPFLADDYRKAKKLWEVTRPIIAERLSKQGIRLLYGVPWPPQAFYTKTPVNSVADVKGVKARAYNAVTARMAELMGAIPATVPAPEVPQAFSTGLVGMMYTSAQTGVDTQAWDFTRYVTMVGGNHSMNVTAASTSQRSIGSPLTRARMADAAGGDAFARPRWPVMNRKRGDSVFESLKVCTAVRTRTLGVTGARDNNFEPLDNVTFLPATCEPSLAR